MNSRLLTFTILIAALEGSSVADEKTAASKPATEVTTQRANTSFWFPLRHDAQVAMDHAEYHFRRGQEKAAASEIQKAICWLEYAKDHAEKTTSDKLWYAIQSLKSVQLDLKKGDITNATAFDNSISRAGHAYAEWHLFQAKSSLAENETAMAAQHLATAADYLRKAATAANFQYGGGEAKLLDTVFMNGRNAEEGKYKSTGLGDEIQSVEDTLKRFGESLESYDGQ